MDTLYYELYNKIFMDLGTALNYSLVNRKSYNLVRREILRKFVIYVSNKITNRGLKTLRHIKYVNLSFCRSITDNGLKYLSNVIMINLASCRQIGDIGLQYLKSVNKINLSGCNKITLHGINTFLNKNISHMDLSFTHLSQYSIIEKQVPVGLDLVGLDPTSSPQGVPVGLPIFMLNRPSISSNNVTQNDYPLGYEQTGTYIIESCVCELHCEVDDIMDDSSSLEDVYENIPLINKSSTLFNSGFIQPRMESINNFIVNDTFIGDQHDQIININDNINDFNIRIYNPNGNIKIEKNEILSDAKKNSERSTNIIQ